MVIGKFQKCLYEDTNLGRLPILDRKFSHRMEKMDATTARYLQIHKRANCELIKEEGHTLQMRANPSEKTKAQVGGLSTSRISYQILLMSTAARISFRVTDSRMVLALNPTHRIGTHRRRANNPTNELLFTIQGCTLQLPQRKQRPRFRWCALRDRAGIG